MPRQTRKPTCDDCFFRRAGLCALVEEEACVTFRPWHPDGLKPPSQTRLVFRSEGRDRAAFAFPTAQETAALYAGA